MIARVASTGFAHSTHFFRIHGRPFLLLGELHADLPGVFLAAEHRNLHTNMRSAREKSSLG